ncbi:MAG: hypothetical protein IPN29_22075 [Saprospiraceae bacterium]|nr:hypothetical protein [Saprospiraceae bacterium]
MKMLTSLLLNLHFESSGEQHGFKINGFMKIGILFLLLVTTVTTNAQSLKDALYGGKLKTDSGTVIKKGDDLSSKIDTSTKKPVEPVKTKPLTVARDSSITNITVATDAAAIVDNKTDKTTAVKDNNKTWKEFMDTVISTLKQEVMTSKKIKKGDYYVMVDYEIGLDGQVTVTNVFPSPENKYIQEQVKERLSIDTPRLNPVLTGNGKPRKVVKRTNFTITKD